MIRDFSKEELQPVANDTEVTLGAGALFLLCGGLVFLCAICFGIGYAVGHRGSSDQSAANGLPAAAGLSAQVSKAPGIPAGSGTKPAAAAQAPVQQQAAVDPPEVGSGEGTAQVEQVGAVAVAGASQPQVKPVLDSQVRPASGVQQAPVLQGQSGSKQTQGWMVQIAAVSHAEDAEVLVDALRKRGYSVTARRDVSDNLIHVQTGPFVNRNDANVMRQKLLNHGYNAIVQ